MNNDGRNMYLLTSSDKKTTRCLPTVNAEIQEGTIGTTAKIYINESLTAYRRRLFGKINAFKNANMQL
jgi:pyrroline-5-carboxylate reductase